jgi:hypothetical protein
MTALGSFETSGTKYPTAQRHIAEDLSRQQHRCENPKYRKAQDLPNTADVFALLSARASHGDTERVFDVTNDTA